MVKAKVYIFYRQFDGWPKKEDLKLVEEDLPPIKDGEFLAEAVYISIDPFMRAYAGNIKMGTYSLGSVFIGSQVAKILESKHPDYPEGRYVVGQFGCRTHTISNGKADPTNWFPAPLLIPEVKGVPLSYFVSILGMPGNTAYFGFLEICQPKKGETVVVSGAAGAIGSIVGQIAKIKGCTVIGIAGSEEKGKWLVNELGFDHFINYKTTDIDKALSQIAPQGVDCYFDNVGGETTNIILKHMNDFGRVSLCGAIAGYNENNITVPINLGFVIPKKIKMEGFVVYQWLDRYMEGIQQNLKWLQEGKLKYRETVTEGFENIFNAFLGMLQGKNIGKAVVKV